MSMPRNDTLRTLLIVVAVVVCLLAVRRVVVPLTKEPLLPAGSPFPPVAVGGWINGPGPKTLGGDVTVVDVWAYWCAPCRQLMPELLATYEKFQGRDVRFIGLTKEETDEVEKTQAALRDAQIPWPNGYGAGATIDALRVHEIPTLFVVGRDGRIVWNSGSAGSLDEAIESALDKG